jgi:hypothetical protein
MINNVDVTLTDRPAGTTGNLHIKINNGNKEKAKDLINVLQKHDLWKLEALN